MSAPYPIAGPSHEPYQLMRALVHGPCMYEAEIAIGVASAVTGYAVSSWRQRAIPMLTPAGFHHHCFDDDEVALAPKTKEQILELIGLPYRCLHLDTVREVSAAAHHIHHLEKELPEAIGQYERIVAKAKAGTLSRKQKLQEIRRLRRSAAMDIIETYLYNGAVECPAVAEKSDGYLEFTKVGQNGGCYMLDCETSVIYVGSSFAEKPFRHDKVLPLVQLLSSLDFSAIAGFAARCLSIAQDQLKTAKSLRDDVDSIVLDNSRWFGALIVSNLGASPIAIGGKDCWLLVKSPDLPEKRIPCEIRPAPSQSRDADTWGISTPIIIEGGKTASLRIRTQGVQKALPSGTAIFRAYESGDATARMKVAYRSPGFKLWWKGATKPIAFSQQK